MYSSILLLNLSPDNIPSVLLLTYNGFAPIVFVNRSPNDTQLTTY